MPIRPLLDSEGEVFEPEEIPSLISAFEGSLQRLRLVDRSDPAVLLVARRVIALAREGVRDPIVLRDQVVKSFTNGVDWALLPSEPRFCGWVVDSDAGWAVGEPRMAPGRDREGPERPSGGFSPYHNVQMQIGKLLRVQYEVPQDLPERLLALLKEATGREEGA